MLDALGRDRSLGDIGHASAPFAQLVGNYFGGNLSVALMAFRGPLRSYVDPGDNGTYLVTLNRGNYRVRRWIDRVERDAEFVERERAEAYANPYHTKSPLISDTIDEIDAPIFRRDELTRLLAANVG